MTATLKQQTAALNDGAFEDVTCGECGIIFYMPLQLYRVRLADHHSFWCPLGHERHFISGKSDLELARARAERAELAAANAREDARITNAKLIATKGQLTKAKNRAKGGACPCCNRTFVALSKHIATKHPEFAT